MKSLPAPPPRTPIFELMVTPTWHRLNTITKDTMWREDIKSLADEIVGKGLFDDIPAARAFLDEADALQVAKGNCGKPDEIPACKVETRYIYQVFRNTPKESVLAQALLGFELASVDPRVVGINLVGAEDDYAAMADYADQMRIFAYVGGLYPKVPLSLHAGELTLGLVPPEGLCCHVRQAVEVADADRVGHGVDVMYEDDPEALLKDMAAKHVLVEINLTSNDDVLGIRGKRHPFPTYRKFGVPVALSTDDEGIDASISAMNTCGGRELRPDLCRPEADRAGEPRAQLPAGSEVAGAGRLHRSCVRLPSDTAGGDQPSASCAAFLKASAKAAQQWELERRFSAFEARSDDS